MAFVHTQKTYPPELDLLSDTNNIVFVNFFDYTVPAYIKDKQEVTYMKSVKGLASGLAEGFNRGQNIRFIVGDTLARRNTVMSMQDSSFRDTVRMICNKYQAEMLIALDSVNVWMYEELVTDDDDNSTTSEYYLYSSNYITLYSADGEVLDRSTAESSKFYKSRPAFLLGLITFTPSLAKAADDAAGLSKNAGYNYTGKFFPSTENIDKTLYTGKIFEETNKQIISGNPVLAIEPLRELTGSTDKNIARKAGHNLSVVYEIMDNRRSSDQVVNEFNKK